MAKSSADKRGLKRICPNCGTRYYDFNNRPITCPSCNTEFAADLKQKSRKQKAEEDNKEIGAQESPAKSEKENTMAAAGDEISLEDVKEDGSDDDDESMLDDEDVDLDLDDLEESLDDIDNGDDDMDDDDFSDDLDIKIEKEDD